MRPKSSSLVSTLLTVFGGGGMLPMTPRIPSPPSNMEVETLCFRGVFLLRGQDNCTASKGWWTVTCAVRARALKIGRGWVFQHDNEPKHTSKATKAVAWTHGVMTLNTRVVVSILHHLSKWLIEGRGFRYRGGTSGIRRDFRCRRDFRYKAGLPV